MNQNNRKNTKMLVAVIKRFLKFLKKFFSVEKNSFENYGFWSNFVRIKQTSKLIYAQFKKSFRLQ